LLQIEKCLVFYDIEREWYFIAPNQEYKIPKEHFDLDCWKM
jgi:hypothetical protein